MLIANICLYREKITPCYIYGGGTRGMLITRVDCIRISLGSKVIFLNQI